MAAQLVPSRVVLSFTELISSDLKIDSRPTCGRILEPFIAIVTAAVIPLALM
jgi:hypothetical protein